MTKKQQISSERALRAKHKTLHFHCIKTWHIQISIIPGSYLHTFRMSSQRKRRYKEENYDKDEAVVSEKIKNISVL